MPRISLWKGPTSKGADYRFTDRIISEFFNVSGTALYLHLYEGTYGEDGDEKPVTTIQDVLFQENRDRKYSKDVFEMRGTYNVQDNDFDLRQFGFFMGNDTLFVEVHLNDMLALLGRKIMPGDVVELPHQRDDALLNGGEAINKYYVVEDVSKAAEGYSATWWPHIWRVKISPMTGAQEFNDILDKANKDPFGLTTDTTLRDLISTEHAEHEINDAVLEEARSHVFARNFETRQFYFMPGSENGDQKPWIWAGDGVPPNGAELLGSGNSFPDDAPEGAYYLRTNYSPAQLFRRVGSSWQMQEVDWRMSKWSAMHRHLDDFINNTKETTHDDGTVVPQKVSLSKVIRPPTDF
jgi:hypothetical protein